MLSKVKARNTCGRFMLMYGKTTCPGDWDTLGDIGQMNIYVSIFSNIFLIVISHWLPDELCLVAQSCPTLCDPMDCNPPDSSVHGDSLGGILEWVAMPPRGDLPNPGIKSKSPALQVYSLLSAPPGKPNFLIAKSTALFFLKTENTGTHILDNWSRRCHHHGSHRKFQLPWGGRILTDQEIDLSGPVTSVRNLQYPKGKHAQLHSENESDSHSVVSDSLQPNGLYSPLFMEFSRTEYWSG